VAPRSVLVLVAFGVWGTLGTAPPLRAGEGLTLPPGVPAAARERLLEVARTASVSTRTEGEPFVGRREVFEYLLDHPEFATHVTRSLRLARYRVWREPDGLWLDDGWGATGRFDVVHATDGTRVMYARGQYRHWLLPTIRGQAVVVIEYGSRPAPDDREVISTVITGFVKLDSRFWAATGKLLGDVATAKAEREARKLVKVFARTTRAVEENPAAVTAGLRERGDVPARELAEFERLLSRR
jgi:hypothetical protein